MLIGLDLKDIINQSEKLFQIQKNKLKPGDYIYLKTLNSLYLIKVADDKHFIVSGGWFDQNKLSPFKLNISGCTWGGSVIKTNIIAARGLCIEFSNKLMTSAVQKIFFLPYYYKN